MTGASEIQGVLRLETPISAEQARALRAGQMVEIHGTVYCGRDAALPRLVRLLETAQGRAALPDLEGSVIFHTAVSPAGIGPTTSNKVEIEESIPALARAGVRIHLGKGALSQETVSALAKEPSVFAVTPPVSALFSDKIVHQEVAAFAEEGMEALFRLQVKGFPAIIAAAVGESIFSQRSGS